MESVRVLLLGAHDTPRDEELYEDAPEAFAYFMGLAPGRRIDDGDQGRPPG